MLSSRVLLQLQLDESSGKAGAVDGHIYLLEDRGDGPIWSSWPWVMNRSRLRGLFITHGHEDHIGAIPYVLKQVNMPIYCTRFTAGLIKLKLQEHRLLDSTKLVTVEAGQTVKAGKFQVEFIHVNHSIADSVAFAIHTRMGVVVHTGDFKIDSTPIDGEVIDLARFGALGKEGVLALLADSTNVERPGFTKSERRGQDLPAAVHRLQAAHHRHHLRQQRPPHPADHRRCRRATGARWPLPAAAWRTS